MFSGKVNAGEILNLSRRTHPGKFFFEHLAVANDGVQRRPEFMLFARNLLFAWLAISASSLGIMSSRSTDTFGDIDEFLQ